MREYIIEISIDTDGDWCWRDDYRRLLADFEEDGGFNCPVMFFDDFAKARSKLLEVLGCAINGGIYRNSSQEYEGDYNFVTGLKNIYDIFADNGNMDILEHTDKSLGGIRAESNYGNWHAYTGFLVRIDGRIASIYDIHCNNVRN